ncbi:MAG TPA: 2-C-methyl-D-erythritol 4-phosphate cytidylyltransferase [Candidatus Polarisedimenticolia bacterium]|jgi:2-C-methyl-D-erythritol 4-phosphate cytidylyltransferase|nr:2-C-methyl-D-erythritol 4-phosphate cytidylyltransferase [Candidatus Polarisedimenticolia bacterium]
MTVAAILVAAGRGARMGADRPKAFLRLGGTTLLERALRAFTSHPGIGRVVVAVPDPGEAGRELGPSASGVLLVRGGAERQDSVRLALEALRPSEADIVLVHDAARPLVSRELIDAVIAAAREHGAAVPVVAPAETIKRLAGDGHIEGTLPRETLRLAQTPQGFRTAWLREAHALAARDGFRGTDDAALVERSGIRPATVPGSPGNLKITTPLDLVLAETLLAGPASGEDHG